MSIKRYFYSPSFSCVGLYIFERKLVSTLIIFCLRVKVKLFEVIHLSAGRFSYNKDNFELGDLVLKWDSINEDKGKHEKFNRLWKGPYTIQAYRGNNSFLLNNNDGSDLPGGPANGRMLNHYLSPQ
jgi:hypothetical protein